MKDPFEEAVKEYTSQYQIQRLQVITTKHDTCDRQNSATAYKYHRVTTIERMNDEHYEKYNGRIVKRIPYTIPPQKFYTRQQLETFVKDIRHKAGRTIDDNEMMVILRNISSGRQYETTFLVDITDELQNELKWRDKK